MEEKTTSPVPSKESKSNVKYRFDIAMRKISDGYRMRRLSWDDEEYIELKYELIKLHFHDGEWYNWAIHESDLTADDYVIVEKVV